MINKVFSDTKSALEDVIDGASILVGGFGGMGAPFNLINALVEMGRRDLTVISDSGTQWGPFVEKGLARKLITGWLVGPVQRGTPPAIALEQQMQSGKLEVEALSHGTLDERIRAGGMGIAAFYVRTGVGTEMEIGKEKRVFNGEEYLLEHAITADFALIKGYKADRAGNIVCRLAARNRNPTMATAAKITIAEVEHIVDAGSIDPDQVHIPGIFVHRVVQAPKIIRIPVQRG